MAELGIPQWELDRGYGSTLKSMGIDKITPWKNPPAPPKKPTNDNNYVSSSGNSERDAYSMYLDELREQQREQEAAVRRAEEAAAEKLRQQINAGVNTLQGQLPGLQNQYKDSAQQAYVQYMMSRKAMPEALAAGGINGGASESTRLALETNYGNSLNNLQRGYDDSVSAVNRDVENLKATGNISIADNANAYAMKLAELNAQNQNNYMNMVNNMKQSYASKSSGGSSASNKPKLSYDQLMKLYDSGNRGQDVVNGIQYYLPSFTSTSANADSWLAKLNANESTWSNQGRYYSDQQRIAERENALQSAYNQGMLTDEEAIYLANKLGVQIV